jgi:hypothetical protein
MPDFDTAGPSHANATPEPTIEPAAAVPGRVATQPQVAPSAARGVAIAPDTRDHAVPPPLRAEVDTELRTLLAHVERNVELFSLASTQPDREAALVQLDTRVELALLNVPAELHAKLRAELIATLGDRHAAVARVLAAGDRSHGARAAQFFGVEPAAPVATPVQRFATSTRGAVDVQAHAARGLAGPGAALPHHDAIQRAFGHHDVGGVRAHVGGVAADAAGAIGARAYATGDEIAFAADPDLRLAAHEAAHVVQQRGGVQVAGGVGSAGDAYEQHADQVAELVVRGENAEALLDEMAHHGSAGGRAIQRDETGTTPVAIAPAGDLATAFNAEFAAELHAFADEPSDGPATTIATTASGDGLTNARLAQLFTPAQCAALVRFHGDHVIPDHLFDGDEVGAATAQQRILIAGHILSVGHYQAGHIDQRVHARMCGHWAELVIQYAGAGSGLGTGVIDQFGFRGEAAMSVVDTAAGPIAEHHASTVDPVTTHASPDLAVRFEQSGLPFESYADIQPGAWLYLYNSNGTAGGNHSVIFSRWAGPPATFTTPEGAIVRYRRAVTMSQIGPSVGGREEIRTLGEHMIRITSGDDSGHDILPITRIITVSAGARPIQTVEDIVGMLGTGSTAEANQRYVERRTHGAQINWHALADYLRGLNQPLIASLASRLTGHQRELFDLTNTTWAAADDQGTIGTLVRLNERLRLLVADGDEITRGAQRGRETAVEDHHQELHDEHASRRAQLEATHDAAQDRLAEAHARESALAGSSREELDAARALVSSLRAQRRHATDRAERTRLLGEMRVAQSALTAASRAFQAAQRASEREHRHIERDIRQAQLIVDRAQQELQRLDASDGYHTAAGGVDRAVFQGSRRDAVTGLLEHVVPQPDWATLAVRAE